MRDQAESVLDTVPESGVVLATSRLQRAMLHALLVSVFSANMIVAAPAPMAGMAPHVVASAALLPPIGLADSIVVEKKAHVLTLFRDGKPMRSYLVALGGRPLGDKLSAGDKRTPEGVFYIDARQPNSRYHLALHISYPDAAHRARSIAAGVQPGGDIMIHGLPNGLGAAGATHRVNDWTNGCVALTDEEIEQIWSAVPIGTPVEIKP
ncbi:MAG: ErfK/YbiS/YcfS/YnhG family protein [Gemmatimonadetes bacterium]|nr:ErfK/YbiS/YcfS/YnhG family protein [Gemmatimonadota bacterium]